jgi:hypothetical protein
MHKITSFYTHAASCKLGSVYGREKKTCLTGVRPCFQQDVEGDREGGAQELL